MGGRRSCGAKSRGMKAGEGGRLGRLPGRSGEGKWGAGGLALHGHTAKRREGEGGPTGAMRRGGVGVRRQHGAHAGEAGGGWHGTVA
jgi:hypothetical protein